MPLNFLGTVAVQGTSAIPYFEQIKQYGPIVATVALTKYYFAGPNNTWERDLHGKVALVTGGTSGLGAVVARELASRGAQVILLVRSAKDEWLQTFVEDMREATANFMIYAEECNLSDLYSIRKFCTAWLDNAPPRRLDMVVCCASVAIPPGSLRQASLDGIEQHLAINYLAHYHLLTLLSPGLRVQPPDRDVRVILTSCVSTAMGDLDIDDLEFEKRGYPKYAVWKVQGAAKLAQAMFAYEFQRQLNAYERPDKAENNVHVTLVDPGMMRSPSFKRFFSLGSVWGLLLYLILWPIWWLFLKTSINGAQSMLFAIMSPELTAENEVTYISDCRIRKAPPRHELSDEELQKKLFETTEKLVLDTEKQSVIAKKRKEQLEKDNEKGSTPASAPKSTSAGSTGKNASANNKKPTRRGPKRKA